VTTWPVADPASSWWRFWRDDAPEIEMTIDASGDRSAAEIIEVINQQLARILTFDNDVEDAVDWDTRLFVAQPQ
jgi:hypothetical protein